jgi:hypothetical protein
VELNAVKKAHDSVIVVDTYLMAGSIQGRGNSSAEVSSGRRSYSTGSLSQPLLGRNVVDINFTQGSIFSYRIFSPNITRIPVFPLEQKRQNPRAYLDLFRSPISP